MTLRIISELNKKGILVIPLTTIRALGPDPSIVLSVLIAELNKAYQQNLNLGLSYLCNLGRIKDLLGLDNEILLNILEELKTLNLITVEEAKIQDSTIIHINVDIISEFIKSVDKDCYMNSWDSGLMTSLNPANKKLYFSPATLKIKNFIDSHSRYADKLPLVYYSYLDLSIQEYERFYTNAIERLFSNEAFIEQIQEVVKTEDIMRSFLTLMEILYNVLGSNNNK